MWLLLIPVGLYLGYKNLYPAGLPKFSIGQKAIGRAWLGGTPLAQDPKNAMIVDGTVTGRKIVKGGGGMSGVSYVWYYTITGKGTSPNQAKWPIDDHYDYLGFQVEAKS
jgi:hypothetical protein